jgi:dolichol-phosphate mannosyltransferase
VRALVVLPTYDEAATIATVLERVRKALPEATILVVDDNSPDGTADIVEKEAGALGHISLLRRPTKAGLGTAYRDGFRWGLERGYDVLVEMDSDLSHDPDALGTLVGPLAAGFDLVIGSRYVRGGSIPNWSVVRRLLSRGGNVYAEVLLGLSVKDSTSGFRAYSASLLRQIELDDVRADSYGFQIEMTYRARQAGGSILEVPIRFVDRELGTSKMSTYTVVEALWLVTLWGGRRMLRRARALQAELAHRTGGGAEPAGGGEPPRP